MRGRATRRHLGPGTFHVGLIVADEFNGAFVGAGIGQTIVRAMPDIPANFSLLEPYGKDNRRGLSGRPWRTCSWGRTPVTASR